MNTLMVGDPALADIERAMRGRIAELEQKYPVAPVMIPHYAPLSDPMWVAKKCAPSSLNTNKNRPK